MARERLSCSGPGGCCRADSLVAKARARAGLEAAGQSERKGAAWIASIEALLRAGHTDLEGLLRALADWSGELRLLQSEQRWTLNRYGP
jgi:hypothetical protein